MFFALCEHHKSIGPFAITSDGQIIITQPFRSNICIYDFKTGEKIRDVIGHTGTVTSLKFFPDDKRFISVSNDKTLRVWNLETGSEVAFFASAVPFSCVDCSAGNKIVAGDVGGNVYILQLEEPQSTRALAFSII